MDGASFLAEPGLAWLEQGRFAFGPAPGSGPTVRMRNMAWFRRWLQKPFGGGYKGPDGFSTAQRELNPGTLLRYTVACSAGRMVNWCDSTSPRGVVRDPTSPASFAYALGMMP